MKFYVLGWNIFLNDCVGLFQLKKMSTGTTDSTTTQHYACGEVMIAWILETALHVRQTSHTHQILRSTSTTPYSLQPSSTSITIVVCYDSWHHGLNGLTKNVIQLYIHKGSWPCRLLFPSIRINILNVYSMKPIWVINSTLLNDTFKRWIPTNVASVITNGNWKITYS